ncbi:cell division protein FtsN [Alteromonas aestuariivivens]|uniref:Cell division protein FtsN n=1 Tax=Alteromonas aestuariivivens TaxID=1938339 RepID=A0A3D8M3H1_9ALTE|nr:SPOR domain-containing protein [Alteromonas aestuariivivens]RDV24181.1 cell division protein FtsN [Alteromonas aestuariivivens]
MAQRDYVSRGRAPQNKNKRKPQTKSRQSPRNTGPARPPVPWMRLVVVLLLASGLGYFLWSINGASRTQADAPASITQAPQQEELPELPEEEWEYIKTLPGYEVEVEVEELEQSDKRYLLQCASFRTRAQADEMKAKIAFQGLEAQIRLSSGTSGDWFRVILGPFDSKRDAERAKHTLRKVNISDCQIWYWNL